MFNHNVILLGSTGYVGSHFAKHLKSAGINYFAPSRKDVNVENCFELSEYIFNNKAPF